MKLNEKYELIKKLDSTEKNLYKARDNFNNIEIFIEPYKEINASDWSMGGKINEELRKLKLSRIIDDYFYTDNKEKKTKIFYKVYLNNPLEIKKHKDIEPNIHKRKRRKKTLVENNFDEESTAIDSKLEEYESSNKVISPKNLERIMVCEKCKTEINLRRFNNATNTAYCEVCHKEHKVIFQERGNKKLRAKYSRYVNIKKSKNKLLIEVSKDKVGASFLMLAVIAWAFIRLSQYDNIFLSFEVYLYIGFVFILFLMVLDKTYVEVTKGVLKSYSKPFSISPARTFKVKNIEQLYVKRANTKGAGTKTITRFMNGRRYDREVYVDAQLDVYNLIVVLKNEQGEFSILETHNLEDALYLEKLIEKFLKIKDVDMAKEVVLT